MKIIITLILGTIAASAVGYWYFRDIDMNQAGTSENAMTEQSLTTETTNPDELKGKNSIMSLFKMGKSMECTFVFTGEGMRSEGTGFFDNGNARIDSLSSLNSTQLATYLIIDSSSNKMYTWTLQDGKTDGFVMTLPKDGETGKPPMPGTDPRKDTTAVTPESPVDYNCKPWTVDSSVFIPPTDVEFMDMSNMQKQMEDMQKNMQGMNVPKM